MRYSERLLKQLDDEIERRRNTIKRLANSIDALGEFLSTAHYAGANVHLRPPFEGDLTLQSEDPVPVMRSLTGRGITANLLASTHAHLHYSLALPSVERPVFFLVPPHIAQAEGWEQPKRERVAE
ncbi:hypothetical protein HI806_09400 [Ralstonia solanacearum]|nr:hypothetical protein BCR16_09070 [Ralstonia solanacearum FJAT-1458]QKL71480.1 hypothetical protein HI806_09400 [Ralstonia solanacearum]QKL76689.1 hypothetical protein HI805_09410 [Ralstonia solanacearum]QKL81893.1 hypothetical protein HI804_09410 [Ralstonia solanacearum]QKL87104.1 hypothetical protein HI803_09415 [Ralstonia solanacearum]